MSDTDIHILYIQYIYIGLASVSVQGEDYRADDAEVGDFIDGVGFSPSWWTLGEEGAEDSGVEISSMSAYGPVGLPPFLLKALLKELRN